MIIKGDVRDQSSLVATLIGRIDPRTTDKYRRRGAALAIGCLPECVAGPNAKVLIPALVSAFVARSPAPGHGELDAETRRNAVLACVQLLRRLGEEGARQHISEATLKIFVDGLHVGMEDYSVDVRGDVGSWVREACFTAWPVVIDLFFLSDGSRLTSADVTRAMSTLVRQSVERIDRVREAAGTALEQATTRLLASKASTAESELAELIPALERAVFGDADHPNPVVWVNASSVYPRMVPLLGVARFRGDLFRGLVVAVGGISETLVRYASSSFTEYLEGLPTFEGGEKSAGLVGISGNKQDDRLRLSDALDAFIQVIESLQAHERERLLVPALETVDVILNSGVVAKAVASDGWAGGAARLAAVVKTVVGRSKDARRVLGAVKIFGNLAVLEGVPAVRTTASAELVAYLAHPYPRVRRLASEHLFVVVSSAPTSLSANEDDADEDIEDAPAADDVEDILLTTDWENAPIAELRLARSRLSVELAKSS
ncbi:hypothetical protein HK405_005460, partial [Cladochytrium tenue]